MTNGIEILQFKKKIQMQNLKKKRKLHLKVTDFYVFFFFYLLLNKNRNIYPTTSIIIIVSELLIFLSRVVHSQCHNLSSYLLTHKREREKKRDKTDTNANADMEEEDMEKKLLIKGKRFSIISLRKDHIELFFYCTIGFTSKG